jgi:hypothetical protein
MYNPTTFEKRKENDVVTHTCLSCHKKIVTQRKSNKLFCNNTCEEDYNEYGAVEYPCIDFDCEDNM